MASAGSIEAITSSWACSLACWISWDRGCKEAAEEEEEIDSIEAALGLAAASSRGRTAGRCRPGEGVLAALFLALLEALGAGLGLR